MRAVAGRRFFGGTGSENRRERWGDCINLLHDNLYWKKKNDFRIHKNPLRASRHDASQHEMGVNTIFFNQILKFIFSAYPPSRAELPAAPA